MLETLSVEQLRAEASRYGLPKVGTRDVLVGMIMTHLERTGPVRELLDTSRGAAGSSGSDVAPEEAPLRSGPQGDTVSQMLTAIQGILLRQDEDRAEQRRVAQQQQQQFARLMEVMATQRGVSQVEAAPMNETSSASASSRMSPVENVGQRAVAGLASGNTTVQALTYHIPEFSGGEDDNVEVWIRRVNKVAQVHGVSDGTLLAASGKMTGPGHRFAGKTMAGCPGG